MNKSLSGDIMNLVIVSVLLSFSIILAACGQALQAVPPDQLNLTPAATVQPNVTIVPEQKTDLCVGITCSSDKKCSNGQCVCASSFKQCGGDCIPEAKCCTNNDCSEDKACVSGNCVGYQCEYNEVLDKTSRECACASGTYFCEAQQQCVPTNACCTESECKGRDKECVKYRVQATACYRAKELTCKTVFEGKTVVLESLVVKLTNIGQNGKLFLEIGNTSLTTTARQNMPAQNGTFYIEQLQNTGGVCKDASVIFS